MIRTSLGLVVAVLLAACQGLQPDVAGSTDRAFGLLSVSYSKDWSTVAEPALATSAQFVRYATLGREQVSRLLGLPIDPARDLPALDACKSYDTSASLRSADTAEDANVELLEAGDLRVQTSAGTTRLAPRHYASLLPFISGVIYSDDSTRPTTFEGPGLVRATGQGGDLVGAFSAQVASPALAGLLSVGGATPRGLVNVARGDLALRWTANAGADVVTYLELRGAQSERSLRCRLTDDGAFDLPAAALAELGGRVTLDLARSRRATFNVQGLETAELRVTVRERVVLQLP